MARRCQVPTVQVCPARISLFKSSVQLSLLFDGAALLILSTGSHKITPKAIGKSGGRMEASITANILFLSS